MPGIHAGPAISAELLCHRSEESRAVMMRTGEGRFMPRKLPIVRAAVVAATTARRMNVSEMRNRSDIESLCSPDRKKRRMGFLPSAACLVIFLDYLRALLS